jgi:hypothetical protein
VHKHAVRAWIASAGSDAREYRFDKIDLAQETPGPLEGITPAESAYLHLKSSFEVVSLTDTPAVIFQSGPLNKGARLEITGSTATLILRDEHAQSGVTEWVVTRTLEAHSTYNLDFEVLDGAFVRATLGGNTALGVYSSLIDVSDIKIGKGFSSEPAYNGILRNVSLIMRHARPAIYNELRLWLPITDMAFLAIAALGVLVWGARSRTFAKLLVLQKTRRIFGGPWKTVSISPLSLGADHLLDVAKTKDTSFDILLRFAAQGFAIVWRSPSDRRVAILIGCLGLGDCAAWMFNKLLLPQVIASALRLDPASLPLRAPLFEGSAPFTDFTEINTFPNYVSNVSWAAPPAEQLRIMLKSWIAQEWPTLWEAGVPLVLFSLIGLLLHLYGMFRLSNVTRESSLRPWQRMLLLFTLVLTLYPIHFAFDRGNVALLAGKLVDFGPMHGELLAEIFGQRIGIACVSGSGLRGRIDLRYAVA